MADVGRITIPEERSVVSILQDTYEEFGLPEQNFQIAVEDVRKSYSFASFPT